MTHTKPIASSGKGSLLRPSPERISLTNDSPSKWTPGHGKRSNKHASRDNHDDTRTFILHRRTGSRDTCENEEPDGLPNRTSDQWNPTAKLLDHVETWEGSGHVYGTQDKLYSDRVADAGGVENGCSIL